MTVERLIELDPAVSQRPFGTGSIIRLIADHPVSESRLILGRLQDLKRFVSMYRRDPFWMTPAVGTSHEQVKADTQWLLIERHDGEFVVLVPLLDGPFRNCIVPSANGLAVEVASGDPAVVAAEFDSIYIASGKNVYDLLERAAEDVARFFRTPLRKNKRIPDFANWFGWCTWDAFYEGVSHDKVRIGLEAFRDLGVSPKFLILDAGWQTVRQFPTLERRLTGFQANEQFSGDLEPTVAMAKEEFGLKFFLAWHAVGGFWGGADPSSLPQYAPQMQDRRFTKAMLENVRGNEQPWWISGIFTGGLPDEKGVVGVVPPQNAYRFFHEYHGSLKKCGVDGVKVDNQSSLECLGHGFGGRVELTKRYRAALEGSVQAHFDGALINCMSLCTDMLYNAAASTLTRSSDDFYPLQPASHGAHIFTNAVFGAWFGEFVQPDWYMFQSKHPAALLHAVGRAVSGGPVYVSDRPGEHDAALLRSLVIEDGSVLRTMNPGRPTKDCLFRDPTAESFLYKVFASNRVGIAVGVFNCRTEFEPIGGELRPSEVFTGAESDYVVYANLQAKITRLSRDEAIQIHLSGLAAELLTVVPIRSGFAPIGDPTLLNSGGAILSLRLEDAGVEVALAKGTEFLAYCESPPVEVWGHPKNDARTLSSRRIGFMHDAATGALRIKAPDDVEILRIVLQ